MIEALATSWAVKMKAAVPDHPSSVAVIKFALQLIIGTILTLLFSLLVSLLTGKVLETFIVLFAFGVLRAVSGGFHFKSPLACVATTVVGANLIAFSEFNSTLILAFMGTSLVLTALFAPSDIEKQTRIPKKHYGKLKIIALCIILTNTYFMSAILATTFFMQSLTLILKRR